MKKNMKAKGWPHTHILIAAVHHENAAVALVEVVEPVLAQVGGAAQTKERHLCVCVFVCMFVCVCVRVRSLAAPPRPKNVT